MKELVFLLALAGVKVLTRFFGIATVSRLWLIKIIMDWLISSVNLIEGS